MEISKKEIKLIFIAAFIAALVLSFNEWGIEKFSLATGIKNLFIAFVFALIIYFVHSVTQKLTADHYEYKIEFSLVEMKRKIAGAKRIVNVPIGPMITMLLILISNGKFIFLVLNSYRHVIQKEFRIGRRWTNIKEFEDAQIALSGPLSQVFLLIVFKLLLVLSPIFEKAMFMTSTIAIFNMLPFPQIDGSKIFFGSKPLYITSLIFIVAFIILIFYLSVLQTVILALVFSLVIGIIYLYKASGVR